MVGLTRYMKEVVRNYKDRTKRKKITMSTSRNPLMSTELADAKQFKGKAK